MRGAAAGGDGVDAAVAPQHERGRPSRGSEDQHGQRRREQPASAAALPRASGGHVHTAAWGRRTHCQRFSLAQGPPDLVAALAVTPRYYREQAAWCARRVAALSRPHSRAAVIALAERHGSRTHPGQDHCPADGFEDRGSHRTTSRSAQLHLPTPGPAFHPRVSQTDTGCRRYVERKSCSGGMWRIDGTARLA